MKKKNICLALFIAAAMFTLLYLGGCEKSLTSEPANNTTYNLNKASADDTQRSFADKNFKILAWDEINELLNIRDNITRRVIENNINVDELKDAYKNSDEKRIIHLLGYSNEDIQALDLKLKNVITRIIDKVPEYKIWIENEKEKFCAKCKSETFFNNFYSYTSKHYRLNKSLDEALGSDCQWAPYAAALALCSLLGPIWYWPCAYVAMCRFCWGPEVDALCGKRVE